MCVCVWVGGGGGEPLPASVAPARPATEAPPASTRAPSLPPPPSAQAIDHTAKALSRVHNVDRPVVFNTYQAYLRGSEERLLEDMERARREGYKCGACALGGAEGRGRGAVAAWRGSRRRPRDEPLLPSVSNTHQAHLKHAPNTPKHTLTTHTNTHKHTQTHTTSQHSRFGAKLVRGAYLTLERRRASERGYASPVWDTLEETHACYDACLKAALRGVKEDGAELMIASVSARFGASGGGSVLRGWGSCSPIKSLDGRLAAADETLVSPPSPPSPPNTPSPPPKHRQHNQGSIELAVSEMRRLGLPATGGGVYFGQLLGMADALTFTLGQNGYEAFKYVPYGPIGEVLPYLVRRAQENSAVVQGAAVGRQMEMLRGEIGRRLARRA